MRKTDFERIEYPANATDEERGRCRKIINSAQFGWATRNSYNIIIGCSGGIDSTVLVHAAKLALLVSPYTKYPEVNPNLHVVYVDHGLRPEENMKEKAHVRELAKGHVYAELDGAIEYGSGIQERARAVRYGVLDNYANKFVRPIIYTAHTGSDQAETKLFQFITGRKVSGISFENGRIVRPFLGRNVFFREDIEMYARVFGLKWQEDSSNDTDKYTRNKIRHHLIPWIKGNVFGGVEKTLGGSCEK